MDMSFADNTSGVDRYIRMLIKGLEAYPDIDIFRINLLYDDSLLLHRKIRRDSHTEVTIPIPRNYEPIISDKYRLAQYNEQVFRIIAPLFNDKGRNIVHIHTLNLIDLAMYIKERTACKIVTHLHCIPWKDLYNANRIKFNELYSLQAVRKNLRNQKFKYLTNNSELQAYRDADSIICVTHCAVDFLSDTMDIIPNKITVIPNGADDLCGGTRRDYSKSAETIRLLHVGILSDSKGLGFILDAVRKAQTRGCKVSLAVAGKVSAEQVAAIKENNRDIEIDILGRLSLEALTECYKSCDAGIIASLQEQCSYVAIEMAMFGIPIITTAVDGLDEMFTDGEDALKVGVRFSKIRSLTVDTDLMADKIISLAQDSMLRERLGRNARHTYEERFSLRRMAERTVEVYNQISK